MNEMVKKLLNLNQLEFGEDQVNMERFDLNAVIKGVLQSSDILIRQKEAKVLFTGGDPLYVWGDEFKVEEVITNYLTNALNHLDYDHTIEITCKKEGNVVKTTVFNTGDPIPEEDLDKVWVKLATLDDASYDFWRSFEDLVALSRVPLMPVAENLKSNVTGALGYWCGYGSEVYSVSIDF